MTHVLSSRIEVTISKFAFYLFCLFLPITTLAQDANETPGIPWTGQPGVTERVSVILAREKARPADVPFSLKPRKPEFEIQRRPAENASAPAVSQWPSTSKNDESRESFSVFNPQTVGVSFLGVQVSETPGYVPPDCIGDVGPTQIVVLVNGRVKVFNKDGTAGSLDVDDGVFWQSVRNGIDVSDPHVRYDRLSRRWYLAIITIPMTGANRILIAVSSDSAITNSSSFTFFQFTQDLVGPTPNVDAGRFADYPTLGVDANALYIGVNMFNQTTGDYTGSGGFVVRKSALLAGSLVVTAFRQLTDGSTTGPYTPQGVHNVSDTSSIGYFIGVDALEYSKLILRRITNPGGTPSISSNLEITVPVTTSPMPQVSKGSSVPLDAIDDRLFAAEIRRNKNSGLVSLWTAHTIEVTSGGVGSSSGGRNGSRWYEIIDVNSTPTLRQSGTLYSTATTNPLGYWMPSVAMSGQGHMALGSSYAGLADFAGIAVAGRTANDVLGTTQAATLTQVSTSAYNAESGESQRWGDYSQTVVDPTDDMTMWTFQEYTNALDSWGLRAIQLLAPPPALPASATPSSINIGASNVAILLTGTSSAGSGFFDPGSGYPRRISAAVSGAGVTVNSVSYTDPTHLTIILSVAANAPPGARSISISNPDGQSAASDNGIISIVDPNCPTISLTPTALPSAAAGVAYNQTISASGGTASYTFTISAGLLPSGLSLSSSGVLSGIPAFGGSYSFTVSASDANLCEGSRAFNLAVSGCPLITLSPASVPVGTVGVSYSQSITASGGNAPYTASIMGGMLPAGISLSSAGLLSGIPTTPGADTFTVRVYDFDSCFADKVYSILINPSAEAGILLTDIGGTYTQNFNSLTSSGTSSSLPDGWIFRETGSNANATYAGGTGSGTAGDTYSFGTNSSDRAFGGIQSGSLIPTIGAKYTNASGSGITSIRISFTGEQWRLGATGRGADRLDFQLSNDATSLSTGTWVDYDSLDFSSRNGAGPVGALDGNSASNRLNISATIAGLNIANGATFYIRWNDVNVSNADDGLAIDDFALTPESSTAKTDPSLSAHVEPDSVEAGYPTLLSADVSLGANPVSTGLEVSADLSNVGGASTQTMFDDGTEGDGTPGDGVYSYSAAIPMLTSAGTKSIPILVTDAQSRSASDTISLTVLASRCTTLVLETTALSFIVRTAQEETLITSGGLPPYTFAVDSGSLPSGLSLSTSGVVSGSPQMLDWTEARIVVTDGSGCEVRGKIEFEVWCPDFTFSATWPDPDTIGKFFSHRIAVEGGTEPYFFELSEGIPPDGLALDSSGLLSGILTSGGTRWFEVMVTDSFGCGSSYPFNITVLDTSSACASLSILPSSLPEDTVGNEYAVALQGQGGIPPYSLYLNSGSLPPGLRLTEGGEIVGIPKEVGDFNFSVEIWDSSGCRTVFDYTINVVKQSVTIPVAVSARWNLLSNPVTTLADSVYALYSTASTVAYSYDVGGYEEELRMRKGRGYWLKFPDAKEVLITGEPTKSDTVTVKPGWNLIGSVSRPIPVSGIGSIPEGMTTSEFFGYDNAYTRADVIEPGKGYWVRVGEEGLLLLDSLSLSMRQLIVIVPGLETPPAFLPDGAGTADDRSIPGTYTLAQNFPNPFNPVTTIEYGIPLAEYVSLKVYDVMGREIAILVGGRQDAGMHRVEWDASGVPSGVYLCRMAAREFSGSLRMVVLK